MFFSEYPGSMSGKENVASKGNVGVLDQGAKDTTPGKKEWKMVGGLATPEEGVRKVKRRVAQPLRPSARVNSSATALTFPAGDYLPRTQTVVFPDAEESEAKDEALEDVLVQLQGLTIQAPSATEGITKSPQDVVETHATADRPTEGAYKKTTLVGRETSSDRPSKRIDAPQEIAVASSIQARIAAVFATVDVPVHAKQPAMRRVRTPTLLETDRASRDVRIQHEVEALRGLQRVDRAAKILASLAASGGGTMKAASDDPLSLQSMHILARYMSERGE